MIRFFKVAGASGAIDPTGRGREVEAFDANGDGLVDIFVGNAVGTVYPSPNRLYLNTGTSFVEKTGAAINKSRGLCIAPADYDEDGDMDIFVCGTPNHLLRQNADGSYTDLGKSLGLSPEQPSRDAQWSDLDRDGDLDLIQMSVKTLRVFYANGTGGFALGIARPVVAGRASAVIDVDVDGDDDIYVVLGKSNTRSNMPDFLMLNSGDGRELRRLRRASPGDDGVRVERGPDPGLSRRSCAGRHQRRGCQREGTKTAHRLRGAGACLRIAPFAAAVTQPFPPIPGRPAGSGSIINAWNSWSGTTFLRCSTSTHATLRAGTAESS